jgi:L-rhamnose-H+ transport protein
MSLVLVAWPVALFTVPDLRGVFAEADLQTVALPALLGAGWGAGGIYFGLGLDAVGIALGVSLILGLNALIGSLLPLVFYHAEQLSRCGGKMMIVALVVMLCGIVLSAFAGSLREKGRKREIPPAVAAVSGNRRTIGAHPEERRPSYRLGLLFCGLSGALSPMVNFALITGNPLRQIAIRHGASPLSAVNAVWLLVFNAAYGVFALYALYLMLRNKTTQDLWAGGSAKYWVLAAVMGLLWAGGIVVYGIGVAYMGGFGAYGGWPMMLIVAIVAGNVSGIVMGEWKNAGRGPLTVMVAALAVLCGAAILLGVANKMLAA